MGNGPSMEDHLFNLKFSAKQLARESSKCDQMALHNRLKCKKAMEANNMEGARIFAETAIRDTNQSLNYLRLSSRIDAVSQRVHTAVKMKALTQDMRGIVKAMESVLHSMNVEKITAVMDKFEQQFENLDLSTGVMEGAMHSSTSMAMPEGQVESLMQQVAEEHGLEFTSDMPGIPATGVRAKQNVNVGADKKENVIQMGGGVDHKDRKDDDDSKSGQGNAAADGGIGDGASPSPAARSAREEEESLEQRLRRLQGGGS